jgi:hypothetical protein
MPYIVMTAAAAMPQSCWGRYSYAALVKVAPGYGSDNRPKMISKRARGVVRIIEETRALNHAGSRSAFVRAHAELAIEAARLNTAEVALLTANL